MELSALSAISTEKLKEMRKQINQELKCRDAADLTLPSGCSVTVTPKGYYAFTFPYCAPLIEHMHNLLAIWEENTRSWWVTPDNKDRAYQAVLKYFPLSGLVEKTVTFSREEFLGDSPHIDGAFVVDFGRDFVGHPRHHTLREVLANTLTSGGSKNYPTLAGTLKVRVLVRPEAEFTWKNATISAL